MAGCRASYRRVDRLAGTHDMDRFALTQDIDHSPAAKDHEDFAAPFLSADCRRSGGMCGALRHCAFRRQADLRRVFKGSSPEFIEITVREDSDTAAYEIRQLDEDPGALPFQVSAAWRAKMFDLAAQLKHFQGQDLDVHRKIANLGEKTFRWEFGTEVHEAKFN